MKISEDVKRNVDNIIDTMKTFSIDGESGNDVYDYFRLRVLDMKPKEKKEYKAPIWKWLILLFFDIIISIGNGLLLTVVFIYGLTHFVYPIFDIPVIPFIYMYGILFMFKLLTVKLNKTEDMTFKYQFDLFWKKTIGGLIIILFSWLFMWIVTLFI